MWRIYVYTHNTHTNTHTHTHTHTHVYRARNGKTSEIGNTDAEGRLVLADALVAACEESPDLLIDLATLTGAGRVALGTDVPAVFVNDEEVAVRLQTLSQEHNDLTWRLPLFKGYVVSKL